MRRRLSIRGVAAIAAAAILAGCVSQPSSTATPRLQWQTHNARMLNLQDWHLEGKLGYRSNGNGGSARVDWRQLGERFDVHLSGPFGAGITRIHGDDGGAVLSQAGRGDRLAPTPSALTEELFGWTLPVEQLRYWVRGVPDPHLPVAAFRVDAAGTLSYLQQQGWQLRFSDYGATVGGTLPGKIVANREIPGAIGIHVTLVIKAWDFDRSS